MNLAALLVLSIFLGNIIHFSGDLSSEIDMESEEKPLALLEVDAELNAETEAAEEVIPTETPTPTATPTATPTLTPTPTAEVTPTPVPEETPTPEPEESAVSAEVEIEADIHPETARVEAVNTRSEKDMPTSLPEVAVEHSTSLELKSSEQESDEESENSNSKTTVHVDLPHMKVKHTDVLGVSLGI